MRAAARMGDAWDEIDELGCQKLRWGVCFVLVTGLLAGGVWIAAHSTPRIAPPPAPPPAAIMIDFAPLPAAPPAPATETPPGPQQTLSQPPPESAVQPKVTPPTPSVPTSDMQQPLLPAPPSPAPDIAIPLAPAPPPRPLAEHRPRVHLNRPRSLQREDRTPPAPATTAPPEVQVPPAPAAASAAPMPAISAPPSNAVPTWQGRLLGRLEQFRRYPEQAQYRQEQGVVYLHFSMDRTGKVLSARIAKSSGFGDLDQETLALVHRAEPLPPPPTEVPGDPIELTVPVQFFLHGSD